METNIFFRADGNQIIGLGHIFRCIALASILKEYFNCFFIVQNPSRYIKSQISNVCKAIVEIPSSVQYENEASNILDDYLTGREIVVLDGYQFTTNYQSIIRQSGCKLVCIDDTHSCHFVSDVVINHASYVHMSLYSLEPYTKLFLGSDYSILRKPFYDAAKYKREIDKIQNVFICFGGSDSHNLTLKVLRLLDSLKAFSKFNIVLGGANKFKNNIYKYAADNKENKIEIFENLSASQMVSVIQNSDIAVVPASTILYEVMCVNIPVISGFYIDNQKEVYEGFKKLEVIIGIDDFISFNKYKEVVNSLTFAEIHRMLNNQHSYFKKVSHLNLLKIFIDIEDTISSTFTLVEACKNNLMLYYKWVNDQAVRENSTNQDAVSLTDHKTWYYSRLSSEYHKLYVLCKNKKPLGQIRFELKNKDALISYSIDAKFRGLGLGKKVVTMGIANIFQKHNWKINRIVAKVKEGNIASSKVFERLHFQMKTLERINNESYKVYILEMANSKTNTKNSPQ